ncbi:MAG: STAS domain-containing protein [Candidatus Krumholzibacteriota bacterium]|nr:STAS domain-containing protein [Candidatus Krumholzibacteriota bacterium]
MSSYFTLHPAEFRGQTAVLRLSGRLDAESALTLRQHCAELREQGQRRLILVLSGVTFVASSGVGTLLALTEEFRTAGGCLGLAEISPAVASVFKLLNLEQFLEIHDTLDEACAALGVQS